MSEFFDQRIKKEKVNVPDPDLDTLFKHEADIQEKEMELAQLQEARKKLLEDVANKVVHQVIPTIQKIAIVQNKFMSEFKKKWNQLVVDVEKRVAAMQVHSDRQEELEQLERIALNKLVDVLNRTDQDGGER